MNTNCISCGSARVLRNSRPMARGFFGPYQVTVQGPVTSTFGGRASSPVSAEICVDCGRVEFRARDLIDLAAAYEALGGATPLGLNRSNAPAESVPKQ
jgi:hypothetical protein